MTNSSGSSFTHLNERGEARMVDISDKPTTVRTALASCVVRCNPPVMLDDDALTTARITGVLGAGKTSDLIPLCHPIPVGSVEIDVDETADGFTVTALVTSTGQTGVEMEALTGVTVAALNLVAALKAEGSTYRVDDLLLLRKSGGKSGVWGFAEVDDDSVAVGAIADQLAPIGTTDGQEHHGEQAGEDAQNPLQGAQHSV